MRLATDVVRKTYSLPGSAVASVMTPGSNRRMRGSTDGSRNAAVAATALAVGVTVTSATALTVSGSSAVTANICGLVTRGATATVIAFTAGGAVGGATTCDRFTQSGGNCLPFMFEKKVIVSLRTLRALSPFTIS